MRSFNGEPHAWRRIEVCANHQKTRLFRVAPTPFGLGPRSLVLREQPFFVFF
jgi:hypothetical protein